MSDLEGEAYWRERAEQLQHALDSRIVVEQAKGILSERIGLEMDGAFSLLRYAARGAHMKIHDLAQLVVDSDGTPEPVVRALARIRLDSTAKECHCRLPRRVRAAWAKIRCVRLTVPSSAPATGQRSKQGGSLLRRSGRRATVRPDISANRRRQE